MLPQRDGVGASCVGLPPGPWSTMLDFLVDRFPHQDRAIWMARMNQGRVMDEHGVRIEKGTAQEEDDPFATFTEWASEADEEAYADL